MLPDFFHQQLGFLPSFNRGMASMATRWASCWLVPSKAVSSTMRCNPTRWVGMVQLMVRCSCSWCGNDGKFSHIISEVWHLDHIGYGKIFTGIPGFKPWFVAFFAHFFQFLVLLKTSKVDIPVMWVVTIGKKQRSYGAGHPFLDARHEPPQQHQIFKDLAQPWYRNLSGMHIEYSLNFI